MGDLRGTASPLGNGRVSRVTCGHGRRGCSLGAEPAEEVLVLEPPLGVDGHLAPQPVKLTAASQSRGSGNPAGETLLSGVLEEWGQR